jgi:hypothetical protein
MRKKQNTGVAHLASVDPASPAVPTQCIVQIVIFTAGITKSVRPRDRICISFYWHQGGRHARSGPFAIGPPVRTGLPRGRNHLRNTAREKQRGRPIAVVHEEALTAGTGEGIRSH